MTTDQSHPVPVGRAREYHALASAITPDAPRLLVLAGQPGSGRSYMIDHLRAVAVDLGFRCIGVDEELVVDRTTTSTDVLRVLRTLGGAADDPAPEPAVARLVRAAVVAAAVPRVPSAGPAGVRRAAASRRSSGAKSSTTCRRRRSAACRFRAATVR